MKSSCIACTVLDINGKQDGCSPSLVSVLVQGERDTAKGQVSHLSQSSPRFALSLETSLPALISSFSDSCGSAFIGTRFKYTHVPYFMYFCSAFPAAYKPLDVSKRVFYF